MRYIKLATVLLITSLMLASVASAFVSVPNATLVSSVDIKYHGNVDSKIFHNRSCRWFNCKACTRPFATREKAIKAGFRPCKVCKP